MGGRIRTVKPELLEDGVTAGLSHEGFRLYVGIILLADDWGNARADAAWLHGQVFHARPLPRGAEDLETHLEELARPKSTGRPGLIVRYSVRGQRYCTVSGWFSHQKVSHPGSPRTPTPLDADERPVRAEYKKRASSWLPLSQRDLDYGGSKLQEFLTRLSGEPPSGSRSRSRPRRGSDPTRAHAGAQSVSDAPASRAPEPDRTRARALPEKSKHTVEAIKNFLDKRGGQQ